eukprot:2175636-Prymnesium_polylepis.1
MPCVRHGCGGACIDGKVYIVGGEYAERYPGQHKAFCSVYDLEAQQWSSLEARFDASLGHDVRESIENCRVAFVPVGAVWG